MASTSTATGAPPAVNASAPIVPDRAKDRVKLLRGHLNEIAKELTGQEMIVIDQEDAENDTKPKVKLKAKTKQSKWGTQHPLHHLQMDSIYHHLQWEWKCHLHPHPA